VSLGSWVVGCAVYAERLGIPERLATATLVARLADLDGAAAVLAEPVRFTSSVR
jgi:hypothetical protein